MHDNKNIRYAICQEERPKLNERSHLQGYVEFSKSLRMSEVKKILGFNTIHLEPRKGSRADARGYSSSKTWKGISKGRIGGPFEKGTWRNDMSGSVKARSSPTDTAVACLLKGMTPTQIASAHPRAFFQHSRKILDTYEHLKAAVHTGIFEYEIGADGEEE
jgi:hypothetical protein